MKRNIVLTNMTEEQHNWLRDASKKVGLNITAFIKSWVNEKIKHQK